ncbi:MAG: SIS domain-containing protein [Firmicutes bacterium]|nr:SIS domain-containing protein [Bacillota bacterium]
MNRTESPTFIEELVKRPFNFFVGRQIDYALSVEASLKLREVTYLNSVAYPAGELKHGTIALIEKGVFVFALATDKEVFDKTKTNMIEAKSRGAYTVFLTTDKLDNEEIEADIKLIIPDVGNILQPLITILPFQLLSYQTAKYLGLDLDHPRNLAKSVTVE